MLMAAALSTALVEPAAQASTNCVKASQDTVKYRLTRTSLTVSTNHSKPLCNDLTFNITRWSFDKPAKSIWPQSFSTKDVATIRAGHNTATASINMGCGQVDAYKGRGPTSSDRLTGPSTPYKETFLSTVATGNARNIRDKHTTCATKVMGNVVFNEGSGTCIAGQWSTTPPSFTVGGDQDALADQPYGTNPASFGQDLTVTFTGVAKPDTEILSGQRVWQHTFAAKPAWPASCYVHPVKKARGHVVCGCKDGRHFVKYVLDNSRSKNGTRHHPAAATFHMRLGAKHWSKTVAAGDKVVLKRFVRRGTRVSLSVYGHVLDHARASGSCTQAPPPPIGPPGTGERTLSGGKVVSGKA
jgi:hypothetical protein